MDSLNFSSNALAADELDQALPVLAHLTLDAVFQGGKLCAFGLAHIEDIRCPESDQYRLILLDDVLFGFLVLLAANSNHRGKDADTLLTLLHLAS